MNPEQEQKKQTVEEYTFEPIKGYPMLNWKGKRPYLSTQYYPAQLKESYGNPDENNWMNKIFWGDNLQVMSHMLKEYRGKIKLIYLDPPFDSKADYKKKIKIKEHNANISTDSMIFEEKQYSDIWVNDEYLQFLYERLILIRELLSEDGSVFLHCDWHKVHHIRCLMDEVFGEKNFLNEIIWCYYGPGSPGMKQFNRKHDNILWYKKGINWTFNIENIRMPHNEKTQGNFKKGLEGSGFIAETYNLAEGKVPEDWWEFAIAGRYPNDGIKRVGYPTEKPYKLLERIILAASNENDIIFDPFMGSGVTLSESYKHSRRFIGADINVGSIQTSIDRLNRLSDNKVNLEVYNVNNYELFRNPTEAKQLILEALEINKLENNTIFDGEKDGALVKIMPVNRIATKEDLNDIIINLDYKSYQLKYESSPNKAVENLLLVCMGHEPDLAAALQKEVPYKLNIEIVDILRNRADLEFKRSSEASIIIEENFLIIENFYPMNLLQKLSLMKENVSNWTSLVETVKIDWNYDGAVLNPCLIDIPQNGDRVKGKYKIPNDAGIIRVKITDVLSESIEVSIENEKI